ncbi:MAG: hypothetical protein LBI57_02150 [Helicobacteraceae bacterium]|jgi:glucan phosphoethanolaminetransferase (alkaline phosphatase superfamily)|nr:hypothetical protein [Helicobacteraceae bacterium]
MSAYGYPLNTTPFLRNANGAFIDGFTTKAGYTIQIALLYIDQKLKRRS